MIIWAVFLLIIWGSVFYLLYAKADEVTKDPCGICAKNMGTDVSCVAHKGGSIPVTRTYFPNGTYYENREEAISILKNISNELDEDKYGKLPTNFTFKS